MPDAPPRACKCGGTIREGKCDKCGPGGKSHTKRLYDSRRWLNASRRYRANHPLCEECLRKTKVTPAQVVDHIVPHKDDYDLFWDEDNWQSLCRSCHGEKTRRGE